MNEYVWDLAWLTISTGPSPELYFTVHHNLAIMNVPSEVERDIVRQSFLLLGNASAPKELRRRWSALQFAIKPSKGLYQNGQELRFASNVPRVRISAYLDEVGRTDGLQIGRASCRERV